jgi:branched-chain amino acid transport system ATP-binding protein
MAILRVTGVSKSFAGLKALNDVHLTIDVGGVHAIIGPNGAGKSTLLNCFVGRLAPDSGAVTFGGRSLIGLRPHEINQAGVARMFQTPEIFDELSLLDNVLIPTLARRDGPFVLKAWSRTDEQAEVRDRAEHMLENVGLAGMRGVIAGSLSRGDKRRLGLAMCLVQDPQLLLLDEPTAGMSRADTNSTIALLQRIVGGKVTMVIIEHDMHVVFSLASRISVLAQGSVIAEGDPGSIKRDERVQEAYLGGARL